MNQSLFRPTKAQFESVVQDVLDRFQESSSYQLLRTLGHGLCWTRPMLQLAGDCMQPPSEIDEFDLMFYIKLLAENHWCPPDQGEAIERELHAFFMFAALELNAPHSFGCLDLLEPGQRWVTRALEREARNHEEVVYPPGRTPMRNN